MNYQPRIWKLGSTPRALALPATLFFLAIMVSVLAFSLWQASDAQAAGEISIEIVTGYNLVVDSNVSSPSTYAPSVATVMGRFCNTSGSAVSNVQAFIGNYVDGTNDTPGVYPVRNVTDFGFGAAHPALDNPGSYAFTHVGGRLGIQDAARYVGTLAPGECRVQYWHFTYPQCENNADGTKDLPPCNGTNSPVWGDSVKPSDDLWLDFDMWAKGSSGATGAPQTKRMTMRNEISAMANKIEPNPDGVWFNLKTSTILPGDVITSNGILYEFGLINKGFDNDGNYVPDYNAWAQPIGDASFDPSCFRLLRTTGVLTVTRGSGNPDWVVPFENQLYFTNLPADNTGVRGNVRYTFLALNGPCSTALSPYQEVASGYDNEKFNGDYGTSIPPVESQAPQVNIDKTGNSTVAKPGTITYQIPFQNLSTTTAAGFPLNSGGFDVDMPLVISDTVPNGLNYVGGSANYSLTYTPDTGVRRLYSTDSGKTWSSTDPGTVTSTWPNSKVILQWWLNDPLPPSSSGSYATYQAAVPSTFTSAVVENCADSSFGAGVPFDRACATTLIEGNNSLGDFVWRDLDGDGTQDGGSETGISGIDVAVYFDRDNDGVLDDTDPYVKSGTTDGNGNYTVGSLPDGRYLVKVYSTDPQLPTGYTLTMREIVPIALDPGGTNPSGVSDTTADFGFGPSLMVEKALVTPDPAYAGENVSFRIDLRNTLAGDGTANGFCQYWLWASTVPANSPPASGTGVAAFANQGNAAGQPNGTYATTNIENNTDTLGLGGMNTTGKTGTITKVETVVVVKETKDLKVADDIMVYVYYNGSALPTVYHHYGAAFVKSVGSTYILRDNVTAARTWAWSDFAGDLTEMLIEANKGGGGGTSGDIGLDAVAYVVTTDQQCAGADKTISYLPLTDDYDPTYLRFVSSIPTPSSINETSGLLTWSNLGPLYAGGTRVITVTFQALTTVAAPGTSDIADVTGPKFATGRFANDDNDSATVTINAAGSIAGTIWADTNNDGWQGTTGYNMGDTYLANTEVELWACKLDAVGTILTPYEAGDNQNCANNGGTFTLIASTYANASGYYQFTGLRDGYYNVKVIVSTLPAGFTTRRAEPYPDQGPPKGFTCGTCDGQWNEDTATLKTFNWIDSRSGSENITDVSFGYRNSVNNGAITGYVWHDADDGGDYDSTEQPIQGVTVYLCAGTSNPCDSGNAIATTTTDVNGFYSFERAPGDYRVGVSPPSGMSQSGDPDQLNTPCTTCDNQSAGFTLSAHEVEGPRNFGYNGGLNIGDTVYTDWDGDGTQDTGEEGIQNVVVYLYRDIDGDGVVDAGEPRLGSATTSATGVYQFTDLPGNGTKYVVVVSDASLPAGYVQTGDPDATKDSMTSVTLNTTSVDTADFGYQPRGAGAIGDTVWNDVDADGVLDATEPGISGVLVKLYQDQDGDGLIDTEDALVKSTNTIGYSVIDGYIDTSGNGTIGIEDDVTDLLGVRVVDGRLDINGNGNYEANDDGAFVGYAVIDGRLDMNGNDAASTDDDGNLLGRYQFLNLPAGDYIVQVDSTNFNSGQPLSGLTMSTSGTPYNASQVSYEVTLAAAQVFTTADLGFTSSAIGDTVWQDNNGNGLQDAGEPGIQNVSVQLWRDTNNDGTGDTQVGTATTDASGHYYFTGLTAGDYVVVIPSTNWDQAGDPLYNFTQTYDPDATTEPCSGGECDNQGKLVEPGTAVGLPLGQNDYSLDLGYQPRGTIGDTLWINSDGDGVRDPGEIGIDNVTVWLCTSSPCTSDNAVQTTSTDVNGYYTFGNLTDGTYYVAADTGDTDFPSGVTPNYNPDGNLNSEVSQIVISGGVVTSIGDTSCSGCNMNADIGYAYVGNNSVSGDIFYDPNNDGVQQVGETNTYAGVTVYLYNGSNELIAQTTTDANGHYTFGSLPDGNYTVSYSPDTPTLDGLQPTVTSSPTTHLHVALDPGGATTGPVNVGNQDFGLLSNVDFGDLPSNYAMTLLTNDGARHIVPSTGAVYLGSAAPDTEWNGQPSADAIGDNVSGSNDEDGIVRTGTWAPGPTGGSINVTAGGCATGCYLSGWIDWNNDGDFDAGERVLTGRNVTNGTSSQTFPIPAGTSFSGVTYYARFRLYDTYNTLVLMPTGPAPNGEVEDHGWVWEPTAVRLLRFEAAAQPGGILLTWETASEIDNLGFNLYRADSPDGEMVRVNPELIPSQGPGSPIGFVYTYLDETATPGVTHYYWLDDIDIHGVATRHGPVSGTIAPAGSYHIYLPAVHK